MYQLQTFTPVPPMRNGLGITSLVFALVGLFFAPFTFLAWWLVFPETLAWAFGIAGLLMGIYGIRRVNHGLATNRGVAIAGTVLNVIAIAVAWDAVTWFTFGALA